MRALLHLKAFPVLDVMNGGGSIPSAEFLTKKPELFQKRIEFFLVHIKQAFAKLYRLDLSRTGQSVFV